MPRPASAAAAATTAPAAASTAAAATSAAAVAAAPAAAAFAAGAAVAAGFAAVLAAAAAAFALAFIASAAAVDGFGVGLAELLHGGLAGELDAALVVDEQDLDLHLVAHVDEVGDLVDVAIGELGDVAEAVGLRGDLDEGAELLDGDDAAGVDLADLHLGGHR